MFPALSYIDLPSKLLKWKKWDFDFFPPLGFCAGRTLAYWMFGTRGSDLSTRAKNPICPRWSCCNVSLHNTYCYYSTTAIFVMSQKAIDGYRIKEEQKNVAIFYVVYQNK